MLLGPGLCIPPRPQFCCGPIAGTSAGPRVVNKNLFVRSQPRCMAGSLSWCCVLPQQHAALQRGVLPHAGGVPPGMPISGNPARH